MVCGASNEGFNDSGRRTAKIYENAVISVSEGSTVMCRAVEEMINDAIKSERIKMVISLLKLGKLTLEEIAQTSELTISEVEELEKPQIA